MSAPAHRIYLAGVHCSGKSAVLRRMAPLVDREPLPRLGRPLLIDEDLVDALRRGTGAHAGNYTTECTAASSTLSTSGSHTKPATIAATVPV